MQEILSERPNLFEPNDYITFYITLDGIIQPEVLADAIDAAYQANESTMSKIVLHADGSACYEKMPQTGCKIAISYENWRKVIKTNEKIPFSLEHGELIRSFIFPSTEKTSFMIMAHHLAGDGKSIVYFIESILHALSGKRLPYRPLTLLSREILHKSEKFPFLVKLYTKFCNRKWQTMGSPSFSWEDYYHIHAHYWERNSSYVESKCFTKEETEQIIDKAKQIGVSVNSYLITAFLQANKKSASQIILGRTCGSSALCRNFLYNKNNRIIGIPLSVREEENKSMTNLTSGISVTHSYNNYKSFAENAGQIHRKISKKLSRRRFFVLCFLANLPPTLIDSVLLYTHHLYENPQAKRLAKIMGYVGTTKDLGITNLTRLDIPAAYDTIKIQNIIFVPPNVSYAHNIIGVSTFNGEMTLTYHGTEAEKEVQKDFFERGIKYASHAIRNMET